MLKVTIIGAGTVGTAMGYLLKRNGYTIVGIASRNIQSAQRAREFIGEGEASTDLAALSKRAEIVFLTTSDNAIEGVCKKLASEGGFSSGSIVFHMSGALPSNILSSARDNSAHVASIHPLQSLADTKEAVKILPGSYFCIEGDEEALSVARSIIQALNGKEITLHVDKKPLYHAGASVVSNFLVATIGFGLELYKAAGIKREDSLRSLIPLIRGTVNNIESIGIPSALTGPISRGDCDVVESHLKAISVEIPDTVTLYSELGKYTIRIALEKGTIKESDANKINELFKKYLRN